MTATSQHENLAIELVAIRNMSRAQLIERWVTQYRRPPPKGISRRLLEYSAAYQAQVKAYGGLSAAVKRKLARDRPEKQSNRSSAKPGRRRDKPSPGTRLVREWHGVTHTVEVLKQGYAYDGELYGSLSEIARRITGARWSGPRFFGV
ncbi:MAG: DUF2924 domain-containing protein [Rhodospirillaceae bacterium]